MHMLPKLHMLCLRVHTAVVVVLMGMLHDGLHTINNHHTNHHTMHHVYSSLS